MGSGAQDCVAWRDTVTSKGTDLLRPREVQGECNRPMLRCPAIDCSASVPGAMGNTQSPACFASNVKGTRIGGMDTGLGAHCWLMSRKQWCEPCSWFLHSSPPLGNWRAERGEVCGNGQRVTRLMHSCHLSGGRVEAVQPQQEARSRVPHALAGFAIIKVHTATRSPVEASVLMTASGRQITTVTAYRQMATGS